MSMFTLTISSLTTSFLHWFMDLTFQVPMQYYSLQNRTLLSPPDTSTTECPFHFGSASSFFLELFLHSSSVAYWIMNSTWTKNFQMYKLDLEKTEEPEIKLPTSTGSLKKQKSSRRTSISALLTMPKPLTMWIKINCGKFWKRWEYDTSWLASWETYMQVRKQQLELDMEQQTGSK